MKNNQIAEVLFPIIRAFLINKGVFKSYRDNESKREEQVSALITELNKKPNETNTIEKMADDIYSTELQRKSSLELKGAALLGAVAIAVSVVSISIAVFSDVSQNDVQFVILGIIFTYAIIHLIASGIASIPSVRTYRFYIATTNDIDESLETSDSNPRTKWIANKIVGAKINSHLLLVVNNYISAAVVHFIHGLIALAIGYILLYAFELSQNLIMS